MAEESHNRITLDLTDRRIWFFVFALIGGNFAAGKLSISSVENQQQEVAKTAEKAADKQDGFSAKLEEMRAKQYEFQGEMRYRLESTEKRLRDLQEAVQSQEKIERATKR